MHYVETYYIGDEENIVVEDAGNVVVNWREQSCEYHDFVWMFCAIADDHVYETKGTVTMMMTFSRTYFIRFVHQVS